MKKIVFACLTILGLVAVPAIAHADDSPASPDVVKPSERRTGRGVGFGMDNGMFGRAFEQGVRVRLPILDFMAVNLRGISTLAALENKTRWELGGRVEVIGHTPVYLNLVRLYGGGGPEIAMHTLGPGEKKARFGGGGHFGFEFFLKPTMSFFTEIGGHAGNDQTGGGTVLAGMMFYPFTGP